MTNEPEFTSAQEWVSRYVSIKSTTRNGGLELEAAVALPTSSLSFYELITHPSNADIFRGVTRCVHRQIVANDGRGGQLVEVENEADWNVLFLRGSVRTRLVVAQDMRAGTMEFALAPGAPSVLRELYGRWTIEAIDPEDTEHESFPPSPDTEGLDAPNYRTEQPAWCFVTLTQRLAPKNVPPFLFPAFAKFAKTQIVQSFEDLVIEIRNINAGRPTLEPYMSCCMKEIITPGASAATPDPQSVLCALEVASSASTSSSSDSDRPPRASLDGLLAQFGARDATAGLSGSDRSFSGQSTSSGASMAMSSHQEPVSHTVPLRALLEGNSDLHNMSMQLSGAPGEDLKTWHAVVRRAVMDYHGSAAHAWTRASRWVDDRWLALHSDGSTSGVEDDDGTVLDQLWLVVA